MHIFSYLIFSVAMGLSISAHAEIPIVFSDVSAGVFRFQVKLAEQGNPEAQYKVGEMYELGKGVPKNLEKAKQWFEKAASKGHLKASYKILFLDIRSHGMNASRQGQVAALRKEATSGNADAQYFLGKMYATGIGVPKNLDNAVTWLNKATFNGIPEAEHEAIAVEEELARINERSARRQAAEQEEARKKQEAERKEKEKVAAAAKAKKEREENLKREMAAKREAERKAASRKEAERRRREQESAESKAAAAERARAEKEKAEQARAAASSQPAEDKEAVGFDSDPCKGKKARFLSICK